MHLSSIAEGDRPIEPMGMLLFAGCRLPIIRASFGYVSDGSINDPQSDEEVPGWDFTFALGRRSTRRPTSRSVSCCPMVCGFTRSRTRFR